MLLRRTVEDSLEAAGAAAGAAAVAKNGGRVKRRGRRGLREAKFCSRAFFQALQNVRPEGQSPFAKFFQVLQHPTAHGIEIHGAAELDEFGDAAELLHLASTSSTNLRRSAQDCVASCLLGFLHVVWSGAQTLAAKTEMQKDLLARQNH